MIMDKESATAMLRAEIERRAAEQIEAAIAQARLNVERAMREQFGNVVLSVLSNYDVQSDRDKLVITVRNRSGAA